jgi:hypothetical protein
MKRIKICCFKMLIKSRNLIFKMLITFAILTFEDEALVFLEAVNVFINPINFHVWFSFVLLNLLVKNDQFFWSTWWLNLKATNQAVSFCTLKKQQMVMYYWILFNFRLIDLNNLYSAWLYRSIWVFDAAARVGWRYWSSTLSFNPIFRLVTAAAASVFYCW